MMDYGQTGFNTLARSNTDASCVSPPLCALMMPDTVRMHVIFDYSLEMQTKWNGIFIYCSIIPDKYAEKRW